MGGGFPSGIGVDDDEAYEINFRGAMSSYHMGEDDIDCMVEQAFPGGAARRLSWTADELNALATGCDVDFSEMWFTHD